MPRIPEVLRTPSGKIELAPQMLLDDLKRPASDLSQPVPELVVIGRRQLHTNNSWMHNLPVLAKSTHCTALMNPADAKKLHLVDGDKARIHRNGRSIEVEVEHSDEMMPGVVSLPHGWGHDLAETRLDVAAKNPGANLNAIIDEHLRDPLSGNSVLSGIAVEMEAVMPPLAAAGQVAAGDVR
jgi:anaerobic selenocysteine-containing dehydrogenase